MLDCLSEILVVVIRQIFKDYFYSLLWILMHHFHARSESPKGELEVLVCEYTQIGVFWEP